jgi:hypothetical protein
MASPRECGQSTFTFAFTESSTRQLSALRATIFNVLHVKIDSKSSKNNDGKIQNLAGIQNFTLINKLKSF